MSDSGVPRAPAGTGPAGRRLWAALHSQYEFEEHEAALVREMVRTVDTIAALEEQVRRDGIVLPGPGLSRRVHPAVAEARQQRIALARLAAALRLPDGVDGEEVRRPQRRVGVRGVYGLRSVR